MQENVGQTPKTAKLISVKFKRAKNVDLRSREYLMTHEIDQIRQCARASARNTKLGHRDDTMILIMFRHALRVGELITLRWEQIDFKLEILHVKRIKSGVPSTHPLRGAELRALRQLKRDNQNSQYVFLSELGTPLTNRSVHHIISKAGVAANLGFSIHPHMLRHSTGFYLANKGFDTRAIQSYMGHSNIKNTVIYTELSPNRFKKFWED